MKRRSITSGNVFYEDFQAILGLSTEYGSLQQTIVKKAPNGNFDSWRTTAIEFPLRGAHVDFLSQMIPDWPITAGHVPFFRFKQAHEQSCRA
jgi:hypothetical protein